MTKAERARELFFEGCNCSQAVLLAFAEDKMDRETALKLCVILTSRFFIRLDIRPEKSILYYSIEEPFGSIYIHVQKQNIGLTNTLT